MNRKTKAIIALVTVVALFGAGFAYRLQRNAAKAAANKKKAKADQVQSVTVSTVPAALGDISSISELTGTLKPQAEVNVSSKVAGRVTRVLVDVGTAVKAGQPLLQIGQSDYRVQLKQAEAALAAARARLEQVKAGARPEEIEQTEASVAQAEAAAKGARRAYDSAKRMYEERTASVQALNAADTQVEVSDKQAQAAQAMVHQAAASLKSATDNLQRMTDLFRKGAVTKVQLDSAQTQADIAKAQLQSAEASQQQSRAALEGARKNLATAKDTYNSQTALQAQLDAAESQYQIAEANLKAAKARLKQTRAGARREDVRASEAQVAQADAAVELARTQLANTVLTAPAAGVVSTRSIDAGEMISPGVPVISLVSAGSVYVDINVTENLVDLVHDGLAVDVNLDAFPGRTFKGRLANLSPTADSRTRAFPARVIIANPDGRLKPGLFATVRLATEAHRGVLLIPAEALVDRNGDQVVFVIKDHVAVERLIKAGLSDGRSTEILSGVSAGDRVVVAGQTQLADGVAVKEGNGVR